MIDRRNALMAQLVVGGSNRHFALDRFRYRLDILADLHDVEIALEEATKSVWYLATCSRCDGTPRLFEKDADRTKWIIDHVVETGHAVVKFEEPRSQE